MSLTKQDLKILRMYTTDFLTEEAKELEHKLTEEIGDQEEYYDAEPQLFKLISKLDAADLWRLVRLADLILSGEDEAETAQYPKYEITQHGNNELKMIVQEANGADYRSYGHIDILDQLIAYDFLKSNEY